MTAFSSICAGSGSCTRMPWDSRILCQGADLGQQFLLGGGLRQTDVPALHAALGTVIDLAPHIHLAGGVLPHQNDRQAGCHPLRLQFSTCWAASA